MRVRLARSHRAELQRLVREGGPKTHAEAIRWLIEASARGHA